MNNPPNTEINSLVFSCRILFGCRNSRHYPFQPSGPSRRIIPIFKHSFYAYLMCFRYESGAYTYTPFILFPCPYQTAFVIIAILNIRGCKTNFWHGPKCDGKTDDSLSWDRTPSHVWKTLVDSASLVAIKNSVMHRMERLRNWPISEKDKR